MTNEAAERLATDIALTISVQPNGMGISYAKAEEIGRVVADWLKAHERSAGAAPIDVEPLDEVAHILAHYAIEDVDWEALRPFIRSAGAGPLDVEVLGRAKPLELGPNEIHTGWGESPPRAREAAQEHPMSPPLDVAIRRICNVLDNDEGAAELYEAALELYRAR